MGELFFILLISMGYLNEIIIYREDPRQRLRFKTKTNKIRVKIPL